jgi:hypothetical protein
VHHMNDHQLDSEPIESRVERKIKQIKRERQGTIALAHLVMFVMFSGIVWFNLLMSSAPIPSEFLAIWIGWLSGVIFHLASIYISSDIATKQIRQQALRDVVRDDLVEREIAQMAVDQVKKRKHDDSESVYRLSDDGELVQEQRNYERQQN